MHTVLDMKDVKPSNPIKPVIQILPFEKGLGLLEEASTPESISARNWNLLSEDLSLPAAVLYQEKLLHNLLWMQDFVSTYQVNLAPHGKTTMAPELFALQIRAGAWGITLATAQQTRVAYEHGVRRVFMANQLVGKQNQAVISRLLSDPDFEYYCLVDSAVNIAQLGAFFQGQAQKLNVLIELGAVGGRAGVRDPVALAAVLAELSRWPQTIVLCGIEVYEGVLEDEESVRNFLFSAVEITRQLAAGGQFKRRPVLLSGAGSAWYDVVADIFSSVDIGVPLQIVLRPGCYLTHDVGLYQKAQTAITARNPIAAKMNNGLQPALQVWAYVQSIPEAGKAIIGLGKRDAAFDAGLPLPALRYRPGTLAPVAVPSTWLLTRMMDQHAFLQFPMADEIQVGDMVAFDISHPCLTFDKWRVLAVVDPGYRTVDLIRTYF